MKKTNYRKVVGTLLLGVLSVSNFSLHASTSGRTGLDTISKPVVVADTVHLKASVTNRQNAMKEGLMRILPEVFESVGFTEKRMDATLKAMSKGISKKVSVLNRYAQKKDFSSDEKMVKQLMADMGIRIGGTKFETRKLSPEFVAAFTPGNIKQFSDLLAGIKLQYDQASKQKGFAPKLECLLNSQERIKSSANSPVLKVLAKEYVSWISELDPVKNKIRTSSDVTTVKTDTVRVVSAREEQNKRNADIFKNAYTLKTEQIKISALPYTGSSEVKLVGITRGEKETRVTMAIPIHFDGNWFSTDSAFYMKDLQTNDRYFPRRVENDIPINRVIIINKHPRTMLEITYIFPPLKKSVAIVDILDSPKSNLEIPSNAAESTQFRNILIDKPVATGTEFR